MEFRTKIIGWFENWQLTIVDSKYFGLCVHIAESGYLKKNYHNITNWSIWFIRHLEEIFQRIGMTNEKNLV